MYIEKWSTFKIAHFRATVFENNRATRWEIPVPVQIGNDWDARNAVRKIDHQPQAYLPNCHSTFQTSSKQSQLYQNF